MDPFSEETKAVFEQARRLCAVLHRLEAGPDVLAVATLRSHCNSVRRLLGALGITDVHRAALCRDLLGGRDLRVREDSDWSIRLDDAATTCFERACREAGRPVSCVPREGPEILGCHVLLGIVEESDEQSRVLNEAGLTADVIREWLKSVDAGPS